ncbi:RadC family protein [Thermodesulfobacteriota bacterium]
MSRDTYQHFWEDLKSGKFASMVKESSKGRTVSNSSEVYNILKPIFKEEDDVETIYGIFLDAKNHIIEIEKLFHGSITGSTVYPREIVKKVLNHKAAAILLAHNHPSGDPAPSLEDREITARVGFVLHAMGVAFHDHIIIGNGYHSKADAGCMKTVEKKYHNILRDLGF